MLDTVPTQPRKMLGYADVIERRYQRLARQFALLKNKQAVARAAGVCSKTVQRACLRYPEIANGVEGEGA